MYVRVTARVAERTAVLRAEIQPFPLRVLTPGRRPSKLGHQTSPGIPSEEFLMKFIEGKGTGFAKVMCVWELKRLDAKAMTARLAAFLKSGADQETGFGGDIMDPRVGTCFPESVKDSIKVLLDEWRKPGA